MSSSAWQGIGQYLQKNLNTSNPVLLSQTKKKKKEQQKHTVLNIAMMLYFSLTNIKHFLLLTWKLQAVGWNCIKQLNLWTEKSGVCYVCSLNWDKLLHGKILKSLLILIGRYKNIYIGVMWDKGNKVWHLKVSSQYPYVINHVEFFRSRG